MKILFSLISMLFVIGFAVWWSMESVVRDVDIVAPRESANTTSGQETPIEQAEDAKLLIESRTDATLR